MAEGIVPMISRELLDEDDNEVRDHTSSASPYMRDALFMSRTELAERAQDRLHDVEFDTMIGIGLSSALVIPTLADRFDCYWAIVRKDMENTHGSERIEGNIGKRWLFVDDFMASGQTGCNVMRHVREFCSDTGWRTELVGAYMYSDDDFFDTDYLADRKGIKDVVLRVARPAWKW